MEQRRFRHKLNMLEPGTKILGCIGILILIGLISYVFRFKTAAFCIWTIAGIVFVVLLVLLAVESYQDKVMNDIAIREDREKGKD